jgi:threonine 3-dehydrogenase
MDVDGRTRVLVLARPEPDAVELVLRPLPALQPDEALVRISHAGICGTDLHIIGWNRWAAARYAPPVALGHELCGEIVDLGRAAAPFRIGERVTVETHLACETCPQCRANRRHTCANLRVFSAMNRGAFADLTTVPVAMLRHVPKGVPDPIASVMEPLGIALRAVCRPRTAGADLLVAGCGPIGLMAIAAARALGTRRIIASDLSPERLALARQLGADAAIAVPNEDLVATVRTITEGRGADLTVDTSGSPRAIRDALAATATGGELVLAGLPDGEVALDLTTHVVLREVAVTGLYGRRLDETWLAVERLLESPRFDISPCLTAAYPLEQFGAALDAARSRRAGKVLFRMANEDDIPTSLAPARGA